MQVFRQSVFSVNRSLVSLTNINYSFRSIYNVRRIPERGVLESAEQMGSVNTQKNFEISAKAKCLVYFSTITAFASNRLTTSLVKYDFRLYRHKLSLRAQFVKEVNDNNEIYSWQMNETHSNTCPTGLYSLYLGKIYLNSTLFWQSLTRNTLLSGNDTCHYRPM